MPLSALGALVVACANAPHTGPGPEQAIDPEEQLVGLWQRPIRGASDGTWEGLDVRAEGIFYLVGIHSMDGLTWRMEGDRLQLATATERYPQPSELTYRIERLERSRLVLSGDSYLAGQYHRSAEAPPTPTPRRRAVAVDANRDRYCRVSRRLADEESSAGYSAYYFEANRYHMSLRLIDEELDMGERGVQRRRYFFENDTLYYYRVDQAGPEGDSDRPPGQARAHVSLAFGPQGRVQEVLEVVNGKRSVPGEGALEDIADRTQLLLADLRRTSECRRTPQEKRRAKRIKRLRERHGSARGGGGH